MEPQEYADYVKTRLILTEDALHEQLLYYYTIALRRIQAKVAEVWAEVGQEATVSQLSRLERWVSVQHYIEFEMLRYIGEASGLIRDISIAMINTAEDVTLAQLAAMMQPIPAGVTATFNRPPIRAVENMVVNLREGTPLNNLFAEMGLEASQAAKDAIVSGLAQGINPRQIAAEMERVTGETLTRTLRIARTEVNRAFREASRLTMMENSDVLNGWVWIAQLDDRTCAACLAMHGTFHQIEDVLDDHCNGRCVPVPWTKTWEELGISGVEQYRYPITSGEEWFRGQSNNVKEKILGHKGFLAYQQGTVELKDFVRQTSSSVWGTMRNQDSLDGALRKHGKPNPAAGTYLWDTANIQ